MDLGALVRDIQSTVKRNSPELLTSLAITGVVTTGYLAANGALKARKKIAESNISLYDRDIDEMETERERKIRHVKLAAPCYIPAAVSGVVTVAAIVGSSRIHKARTTAVMAAYSLTDRAFTEYKAKVVEQIGKPKEEKIRDEIQQDRVNRQPPSNQEIMIVGNGTVLCCDGATMRYFRSNMETLRRAENEINHKIMHEYCVTIDEFYDILDLEHTDISGHYGWDSDKLMELIFSATIAPTQHGNEPCLVFEFNYMKPL